MAQLEQFDILVLGSGEAGKYLAWHMAHAGHRTAVIERQWIGGSCPNINCLPSKNEIWSAKVADLVRHAAAFGTVTGPGSVDMARVRQRKRNMVEGLIAMHLEHYQASGAELLLGTGQFVAPNTLQVRLNDGGTRRLAGDRVFLNVGTHATIPNIPGLAAAGPLTHIEALELDRLPTHLIVLGGGYVSLEKGSRSCCRPRPSGCKGGRARASASSCARLAASRPLTAATFWSRRGARPTRLGSDCTWLASRWSPAGR